MFTSRAEYRTLLRQDNADIRLTPKSFEIGLASEERMRQVENKVLKTRLFIDFLKKTSIHADAVNPILERKNSALVKQSMKMFKFATRPQLDFNDVQEFPLVADFISDNNIDQDIIEQTEIQVKYSGYIEKELSNVKKLTRLETVKIPDNFNYNNVASISTEAKQKLSNIKPETIAQASRISGVSPSDISILLVNLGV
jgi:tRNA uridine 5-carboxymethylaminomethyl modification enzyme